MLKRNRNIQKKRRKVKEIKLPVDLSKEFRLAIAKAGGQKVVAPKLGISEADLSRKLNGERGWKISELQKLFEIGELCFSNGKNDAGDFHLIKEMARKLSEVMNEIEKVEAKRTKKEGGADG